MSISSRKAIAVFQKTGGHCGYCGCTLDFESFTADHILPRSKGGGNEISNLLPCCNPCNRSKAARSIEEFRLVVAAREVGCGIFTASQLLYLKDAGAFPVLNIPEEYFFYFEKIEVNNASI